jgi:hypothetical protein
VQANLKTMKKIRFFDKLLLDNDSVLDLEKVDVTFLFQIFSLKVDSRIRRSRPVRRGVSKAVEEGCRLPALQAGHPRNGRKAVLGVAHPQGIEGSGKGGSGKTLGSPWIPLAISV